MSFHGMPSGAGGYLSLSDHGSLPSSRHEGPRGGGSDGRELASSTAIPTGLSSQREPQHVFVLKYAIAPVIARSATVGATAHTA